MFLGFLIFAQTHFIRHHVGTCTSLVVLDVAYNNNDIGLIANNVNDGDNNTPMKPSFANELGSLFPILLLATMLKVYCDLYSPKTGVP